VEVVKKNHSETMSNSGMIRELFRSLEATLHERLTLIEQVIQTLEKPKIPLYDHEFVSRIDRLEQLLHQFSNTHTNVPSSESLHNSMLEERVTALEEQLASTSAELEMLRNSSHRTSVFEEQNVVLDTQDDIDEAVAEDENHEVVEEEEDDVEEEVVEEEVVEEEQDEQELELEEFEYKGRTYYMDGEKNVYTTDDEGDVVSEPIGVWNGKKIIPLQK
jgi:hypothetical protein